MNMTEFQAAALRTAPEGETELERLQHAAMGLATEVGEFVDPLKKHVVYGKDLDRENLREELFDVLWYLALACSALGADMGDVAEAGLEKLRRRYPQKFTQADALARADKGGAA